VFWLDCATGAPRSAQFVQPEDGPALFKPPEGFGSEVAAVVTGNIPFPEDLEEK
jgi:hypothetical protein